MLFLCGLLIQIIFNLSKLEFILWNTLLLVFYIYIKSHQNYFFEQHAQKSTQAFLEQLSQVHPSKINENKSQTLNGTILLQKNIFDYLQKVYELKYKYSFFSVFMQLIIIICFITLGGTFMVLINLIVGKTGERVTSLLTFMTKYLSEENILKITNDMNLENINKLFENDPSFQVNKINKELFLALIQDMKNLGLNNDDIRSILRDILYYIKEKNLIKIFGNTYEIMPFKILQSKIADTPDRADIPSSEFFKIFINMIKYQPSQYCFLLSIIILILSVPFTIYLMNKIAIEDKIIREQTQEYARVLFDRVTCARTICAFSLYTHFNTQLKKPTDKILLSKKKMTLMIVVIQLLYIICIMASLLGVIIFFVDKGILLQESANITKAMSPKLSQLVPTAEKQLVYPFLYYKVDGNISKLPIEVANRPIIPNSIIIDELKNNEFNYQKKQLETKNLAETTLIIYLFILCLSVYFVLGQPILFIITFSSYRINYIFTLSACNKQILELWQILEKENKFVKTSCSELPKKFEISCENLSIYIKDKPLIYKMCITFKPGYRVAIIGKTGSGKSTCLDTFTRFNDEKFTTNFRTDGSIYINGIPINNIDIQTYWNSFLYITQENSIFNTTIIENIVLNLPVDEDIIRHVAHLSDIPWLFERMNENINVLSGGEKQRVCICRALYTFFYREKYGGNNNAIFADEPTSALDTKTSIKMMKTLFGLSKNTLFMIVDHSLLSLKFANKVLFLGNNLICFASSVMLYILEPQFKELCDSKNIKFEELYNPFKNAYIKFYIYNNQKYCIFIYEDQLYMNTLSDMISEMPEVIEYMFYLLIFKKENKNIIQYIV